MDEETEACVPLGDRKLRACLVTGLVKTEDQWINEGNQNVKCLDTTRDRELMFEVTSPNFDGLVAMVAPDESWVARYQGITGMIRGCYALRVHGELNEEHIQTLEENGVRYRPLSEAD